MGYLLLFIVFLLVVQFAVYLLPWLLPVIAIVWIISFFKKPNVRVYTTSYTYNPYTADSNPYTSGHKEIQTRQPLKDSIDAEYTERAEEEA